MLEVLLFGHKRQGLIFVHRCMCSCVCDCLFVCECMYECICDKTLYMILSHCKQHETFKFGSFVYIKWSEVSIKWGGVFKCGVCGGSSIICLVVGSRDFLTPIFPRPIFKWSAVS